LIHSLRAARHAPLDIDIGCIGTEINVRATAGAFCPQCLAFVDHEHEVSLARPDVIWSCCGTCARTSVWCAGALEFPPLRRGVVVARVPASVYFELARAAVRERMPPEGDVTRYRGALRDAELNLGAAATFIGRYLSYELEKEYSTVTNESVLDRAMRDQRETQERIEALRQQIAQEELHMAEADAFVSMYRRYAGMADGAPAPRS
jgi:hypothetical protein